MTSRHSRPPIRYSRLVTSGLAAMLVVSGVAAPAAMTM